MTITDRRHLIQEASNLCFAPDYEPVSTEKDLREYLNNIQFKNLRGDVIVGRVAYNAWIRQGRSPGYAFQEVLGETELGTLLDNGRLGDGDLRSVLAALDFINLVS